VIIFAAGQGYLDDIPIHAIKDFEIEFRKFLNKDYGDVMYEISSKMDISESCEKKLNEACKKFKEIFNQSITSPVK
jgi:F-type H+/Na+-transporting ATPase subunit alpha